MGPPITTKQYTRRMALLKRQYFVLEKTWPLTGSSKPPYSYGTMLFPDLKQFTFVIHFLTRSSPWRDYLGLDTTTREHQVFNYYAINPIHSYFIQLCTPLVFYDPRDTTVVFRAPRQHSGPVISRWDFTSPNPLLLELPNCGKKNFQKIFCFLSSFPVP